MRWWMAFTLGATGPSTAWAGGPYGADPVSVPFDAAERVIDTRYTLPFGDSLDVEVAEFWVGVTVTLSGTTEFALDGEAVSELTWGGSGAPVGELTHRLGPTPGSAAASFESSVGLDITFDVWEGAYLQGRRYLTFPLLTEAVAFDLTSEPFTPFLLPGGSADRHTLSTHSADLAFALPLVLPIGLGDFVRVKVGSVFRGYPTADATFAGQSLDTTYVEGGSSLGAGPEVPAEIALTDPQPRATLHSTYEAFVASSISYVLTADLFFEIELTGLFEFPITLPLHELVVPLFSDTRDLDASPTWVHPLPALGELAPALDAGAHARSAQPVTVTVPITNEGDAPMVIEASTTGPFTVTDPSLTVAPGTSSSLALAFDLDGIGPVAGVLTLHTSDPVQPVVEVDLVGEIISATVASLTLDTLTLPAGGTGRATLRARNPGGALLGDHGAVWTLDAAAGTVDDDGLVTATTAAGTYAGALQARLQGKVAEADVVVLPLAPAQAGITPRTATLRKGEARTFSGFATDTYGNAVPVSWSSDPLAGSVRSDGRFVAGPTPGTYPDAVTVSAGDLAQSSEVVILPATLEQVEITPAAAALRPGESLAFRAVVTDSDGLVVPDAEATWLVVGAGGVIGASGVFTAGPVGGEYVDLVEVRVGALVARATVTVLDDGADPSAPGDPADRAPGDVDHVDAYGDCGCQHAAPPAALPWLALALIGRRRRRGLRPA